MLRILHEDEQILAVDKPPGRISVGPGTDESLQAEASRHAGQRLFVVHRLDRGTSGILLFAREIEAQRRLARLFETRQVHKIYLALVQGQVEPPSGEIDLPLRAFGSGRMGVDPLGKPSQTAYEVRQRLPTSDLLTLRPFTGRRHQVRVHCYAIGHPVIGDPRYGRPLPVGGAARLMLHALELSLPDASGAPLTLHAEPPDGFVSILREQGGSWPDPADAAAGPGDG
jgi:RluA family pseudouridine synthase